MLLQANCCFKKHQKLSLIINTPFKLKKTLSLGIEQKGNFHSEINAI
jgi:hypothetical protein